MNRKVVFYNELKELIVKYVLAIPSSEIDEMYDYWELNKLKKETKDFKYLNFKYPHSYIHENQLKTLTGASLKGIDLPTWFGEDYSKKKVMILGIDPLRNKNVFKKECEKRNVLNSFTPTDVIDDSIKNEVIIGTPYALHECEAREGKCSVYWTFIEKLIENHFVYCTDIFKTYFYNNDKDIRSYRDEEFAIKNKNHKKLLEEEIKIIKPDVIIAFGNLVELFLKDIELTTTVIKLPHPSGANRNWNKIFKDNHVYKTKTEYLIHEFYEKIGTSV